MALDVWLIGSFNYEKLRNFILKQSSFEKKSQHPEWSLTFHLKGVKDVAYQVYSQGKVHITTDDYSDPYDLVRIIWEAAWLTSRRNPNFKVVSCKPLLSSYERMGTSLIRGAPGLENPPGIDEALTLARADAYRITRVFEAVRDLQQEAGGGG